MSNYIAKIKSGPNTYYIKMHYSIRHKRKPLHDFSAEKIEFLQREGNSSQFISLFSNIDTYKKYSK